MDLTEGQVATALNNLSKVDARGETPVARYMAIQTLLASGAIARSAEFQKRFNAFYRVRRDEGWRRSFFDLFQEKHRTKDLDFSEIIVKLRKKTGRLEASFASKLVASIQPHKPVIDSVVLKNLGLKLPYAGKLDRETEVAAVYKKLEAALNAILRRPSWLHYEKMFDHKFPEASKIAPLKKLDLILWQSREK